MQSLPVVVGFGGFNPGGRSSFHQSYKRTVLDSLSETEKRKTLLGLACCMKLVQANEQGYQTPEGESLTADQVISQYSQQVLDGTLIRRIEDSYFNPDQAPLNQTIAMQSADEAGIVFTTSNRQLPKPLPENWQVEPLEGKNVKVTITGDQSILVEGTRDYPVKSAGQLPSGFDPSEHYNSRFQPRGLQMAIMGSSDAVNSVGVPLEQMMQSVAPDKVGVYASSIFGQVTDEGFKGLLNSRYRGGRPTAKCLPLGLSTMPADFLNAYVLGSVGHTQSINAACATFLYNMGAAVEDIKNGRCRIAFVGNAEAPVDSDLMEGFANMGALATVEGLSKLDGTDNPDLRKASRPFGVNCGFTIGESVQYIVLMDDALAVELGADIHGAVSDVFINADGVKKSISGPGPGNYITFAKAVASAQAIVGKDAVLNRSFVQAHGSSTPQNRVTESHIFDAVAKNFGIENWPITAVKAFLGHTQSVASGDQTVNTLGVFNRGILPGIKTMDAVADDVYADRLNIALQDQDFGDANLDVSFINSKGFGGNNATGVALAPHVVNGMLKKRYGADAWKDYCAKREATRIRAAAYEEQADRAEYNPYYRFGENLIDENDIVMTEQKIEMPGFDNPISLDIANPYKDMV